MKKKITFEEGMQELEALVHGLEAGDKRIRVLTDAGESSLDTQMDTEEAP